jgi:AGCS family alanine or glycine:cation symporter
MASFGIGNMSQVNTITGNITSVFKINALNKTIYIGSTGINLYSLIVGVFLMIVAGLVIVGGIKRIAQVTEKFVPFMAIVYIIGALIVFFKNISRVGEVFGAIFSFAFGIKAVGGAAVGLAVKNAATWGFKRGVFSNEAGLGSSVMVHSASNVVEPVKQGMWGIFEVFADTIVVCTLTAFSILSTGLIDLETGVMLTANEKTALVSEAFGSVFNIGNVNVGGAFIAIAILLFAFSTVLGWSYYGTKAWEFLFGTKSTIIYKVVFVVFIVFGATMSLDLAWDISDTFNGLMALPNLIGVLTLSGTVIKITKNYVARTFKGSKEKPMLSVFPDIQKEQEIKLANEPE